MNQSIDANEPVGVTVLSVDSRSGKLRTISDTILDLLVEAADKGLRVFVDSGAFGLYRSGIDMPWDLVQQEYRRIRDAVPRQLHNKLYFVSMLPLRLYQTTIGSGKTCCRTSLM